MPCKKCGCLDFARAAWLSTGGQFELVTAPGFPDVAPLPGPRNKGRVVGNGFLLKENGVEVTCSGRYRLDISAVLLGGNVAQTFTLISGINGVFDFQTENAAGLSNTVQPSQVLTFKDCNDVILQKGQVVSLGVTANTATDVLLIAWSVLLTKLFF
jgi:hypothetical protein